MLINLSSVKEAPVFGGDGSSPFSGLASSLAKSSIVMDTIKLKLENKTVGDSVSGVGISGSRLQTRPCPDKSRVNYFLRHGGVLEG